MGQKMDWSDRIVRGSVYERVFGEAPNQNTPIKFPPFLVNLTDTVQIFILK